MLPSPVGDAKTSRGADGMIVGWTGRWELGRTDTMGLLMHQTAPVIQRMLGRFAATHAIKMKPYETSDFASTSLERAPTQPRV